MGRRRWSTTVRLRVHDRFERICQVCMQPTGFRGFELDHIIPLAIGGEDVETNLQPLCIDCHRDKTRRDVGDIAKAVRREATHTGAKAPSLRPLPCGRSSKWKKTLRGWVIER